jgi:hypothetical protein
MAALRRRGTDSIDPSDGTVCGMTAKIGRLTITTGIDYTLSVKLGNVSAMMIATSGRISYFQKARDRALEALRKEQILEDLADV